MRPRHVMSLVFLALVLALAGWSFWGTVVEPHPGGAPAVAAAPSPLPRSLAGLSLATSLAGVEAVASVEQLHGKALGSGLDDAWVGEYGGSGAATVWVSRSASPEEAGDLLERMTDRIEEGGSPFTGLRPIDIEGVRVSRLEGMGQVHYYFLNARDVYWLAIDSARAESGLGELLTATVG
ncbi:MAG: hypothetical protein ACYC6T_09220 [Thermoleophilia bacterium]